MRISRLTSTFLAGGALITLLGCGHNSAAKPANQVKIEPAPSSPTMGAEIGTQELSYKAGDTELKGFLAFPATAVDKRPGVLIAHEWWGLNDYARSRARQLAELGYVALAIDMYGGGRSSEHPADAQQMMSALMSNPGEAVARFEAGKAALAADPHVDPSRLAAIGYCMGGAVVLGAMRRGDDFDLVASFHGNYATNAPLQPGVFKGRVLIAHGEADSFTPPEQVAALQKELADAQASWEFVAYPGAKHGFTNPGATALGEKNGIPIAYDAEADRQSWIKLQQVLAQAFSQS